MLSPEVSFLIPFPWLPTLLNHKVKAASKLGESVVYCPSRSCWPPFYIWVTPKIGDLPAMPPFPFSHKNYIVSAAHSISFSLLLLKGIDDGILHTSGSPDSWQQKGTSIYSFFLSLGFYEQLYCTQLAWTREMDQLTKYHLLIFCWEFLYLGSWEKLVYKFLIICFSGFITKVVLASENKMRRLCEMASFLKYWVEFVSEATWAALEFSLWEGFHYEFSFLERRKWSDYLCSCVNFSRDCVFCGFANFNHIFKLNGKKFFKIFPCYVLNFSRILQWSPSSCYIHWILIISVPAVSFIPWSVLPRVYQCY